MIVVDSSAWVELFRATQSAIHLKLRALLSESADIAVTEVVVMEMLAGARSAAHLHDLRARLLAFQVLPLNGLAGFQRAAELYRACRLGGETIRKLTDCLVAVPTIGAGATLLHADADFDVLARHTALRIEPVAS